jgi:hypothetical protein
MKLYFFRSQRAANFGDELNCWLWPRLLPAFFDDDPRELFLGIGSILFDHHPREPRKIVFGAGWGGYTPPPVIDDTWRFYFVRGRLTAQRLGLEPSLGVGDAAILVRSCNLARRPIEHKVAFIPHWESTLRGNWKDACAAAGIHYIDPCTQDVDAVLAQILASGLVLTEAMHGAIVSDALRVPWISLRPRQPAHRMKWDDWASALELTLPEYPLPASSGLEYVLAHVSEHSTWRGRFERRQLFRGTAKSFFVANAARFLEGVAKREPCLSSDVAIDRSHSRMLHELALLKVRERRDSGRGVIPAEAGAH